VFFPFETLFDGCQLVIIANSLIFQSLDYQLVCLFDTHCFVILYHSLVQPVFKHPNCSHLRVVIWIDIELLFIKFTLLVLKIEKLLLKLDGLVQHLISPPSPSSNIFFAFWHESLARITHETCLTWRWFLQGKLWNHTIVLSWSRRSLFSFCNCYIYSLFLCLAINEAW